MNTVQIEIPMSIFEELIEANILQKTWSIPSSELRGNAVQRMQYHISEIICSIVAKEMQKRKLLR